MNTKKLREYFLDILNPNKEIINDGAANDLQINSYNENITKIAFGVSPSIELFKTAKEWGADVIVCHHSLGLSNRGVQKSIPNKIQNDRMKYLYENNMSLFGFHYLLDSNDKIGHSALILKSLGINKLEKFGNIGGDNWGKSGEFEEEIDLVKVVDQLDKLFLGNSNLMNFGLDKVKKIACVSGGGSVCLEEAYDKDIDLFITGEIKESTQEIARELGMNVLWGGHYITERFAMIELCKKVELDLDIECKFIDIMNKI